MLTDRIIFMADTPYKKLEILGNVNVILKLDLQM